MRGLFILPHRLMPPPPATFAVPHKLLLDERRKLHPVQIRPVLRAGVIHVRRLHHPLPRGHLCVLFGERLRVLRRQLIQCRGRDGLHQLPCWVRHVL